MNEQVASDIICNDIYQKLLTKYGPSEVNIDREKISEEFAVILSKELIRELLVVEMGINEVGDKIVDEYYKLSTNPFDAPVLYRIRMLKSKSPD